MANIVGKVTAVHGEVYAQSKLDGVKRLLHVGDPVFEGDVIVTGKGAEVQIAFDHAPPYLLRENETLTLDQFVFGNKIGDVRDHALLSDTDKIALAIQNDESLDDLLNETSSGFTAIGSVQDSHGFVRLLRIFEPLAPQEFLFNSPDSGRPEPELFLGNNGSTAFPTATGTPTSSITNVTLSATPVVAEGDMITYAATLSAVAHDTVTVTLSGGQTIVIASGATSATTVVAAPVDDPYLSASQISKTITAISGGTSFESLVFSTAAVSTSITDTINVTSVSLSATPVVAEGGSVIYTATLSNPAHDAVTVALSNGQSIVIASGATSGVVSVTAPLDDSYVDAGSVSANISAVTGGTTFESLSFNTTAVSSSVTDTIDVTTLNLSGTSSIAEGGLITYTATLSHAAHDVITVTLSNGQTFTIASGATSGSVVIAAPGDDSYVDASTLNTNISGTSGGTTFESLSVSGAVATTSVTDTIDVTTLSIAGSNAVAEGGNASYTLSLTHPVEGSAITVTLSYSGTATNGNDYNGITTVTIPVGASAASFSLPIITDAVVEGPESLTVSIAGQSGGNYESLVTNPLTSSTTTTITDTTTVGTVSLSATPTVAEGGNITYTATLNAPASSPMAVVLSNGQTITILSGSASGSVVAAAPTDDVYVDASTVSAHIINASGGGFTTLFVNGTAADTFVPDTIDATVVTLSASAATVSEGGSITYTATVNNPVTGSPLDITLSNGQHIVIAVGQSSGSSAAFAVRGDDAYVQGTQALNVGISNSSGGNYEALSTSSTVSTNVTDNASATVVTLSASAATVSEGGSITYTATVNNPVTGSPLDITLSNGQHIVIAVGQSSGSSAAFAVRGDDAYVQGTQALNVGISNSSGGNYEALSTSSTVSTNVTDNASATVVTLSASAATVSEGGSITYTATVNNPVTGSPLDITLSNGQHIVIAVGQSSGSSAAFAVRGDDAYVQGTQALNVGISNSSGGNYEALSTSSTVSTNVTDNASATVVTLSASAATVSEGGSITYTATVNNPVTGSPLDITLSNGQHIVIAVGQSSGSSAAFAVRGDDAYVQGTQALNVGISNSSGGNYEALSTSSTVSTNVTDNASATVVTLSASAATVSEGGSITYTATVNNPVTGSPLDITLSNGQHIVIAVGQSSGSSAAFAVRGDDAYVQGTQALNVGISNSSGGNYEALSTSSTVSTNVTDNASATVVTLSASAATVSEGGSITYTATVNNPVTGSPLDITLSNGQHIVIAVGQSSGSSAAFAVRGDDAYVQGTQALNVGISNSSGGNYEALSTSSTVSTNVTDNASATVVTLSASAATVSEGGSITYTATVNNPVTGSPLDITLSNGQHIVIAVGQSSGSSAAFAVRGDDAYVQGTQALNVGISNSSGGNYEALSTSSTVSTNVTDNASATVVTLSASAATVSEGGSITYTATVNNPVTGSPLDITLSNGQHIVIAVGQSSGSSAAFAVRGDDAYVQGTQALNVGISNSSGGNYEALSTSSTVSTNVTDNASATVVTLSASAATVSEGGSITYTATVNNPVTGSPLDITLSNGQHIVIAVGQSSGSSAAFAVRGDDAYVQGTQALNVGISNSSGGNYEALSTSSTVSTNVTDNASATVVTLSASAATVSEGGSITYTATVNNPVTGSPLDITLSNGQHIVIAVGQSSGSSAAFAVRGDDAYVQGTQALNVGISNSSGGNYEALSTSSTVSTNVTDNASATVVTLSASAATVSEGGSITYTATVNNPVTGSPLDITLSNGQHIVIAVGQSSGSSAAFAVRGDDAYVQGTQALNVGISNSSGGNYEALSTSSTVSTNVTDNASATVVTLSASAATVSEGGSITYTATVNNPVTGSPLDITLSNGQHIVIAVGQSSGSSAAFAVRGDDAYVQGTQALNVGISNSSGGNYEALSTSSTVSTNVTDNASATVVTLSASAATVSEGGSITYTATVNNPVTGSPLDITLSNGQHIVIAVGQSSGSSAAFAVRGDDAYVQGTQALNVGISNSSGGNYEALSTSSTVSTNVTDNASATVVTLSASAATVSEGGSITYTATVNNPVTGSPLDITLSNGQHIVIAVGQSSGSSAAFAVRGDDAYVQGTQALNVGISNSSGGNYEALSTSSTVSTNVTDNASATVVTLSASAATVSEGGSITYTATVNNPVTGSPLDITLSNGQHIVIAVGQSSGSSAAFAVRGDDAYVQGTQALNVGISNSSGGNYEALSTSSTVSTNVTDNASATVVTLSASAATVSEGGSITYTATVNNPVTGSPLDITLSNGQHIVIAVGQSSGSSAAFAVRGDDAYVQGTQALNVGISNSSGGNYEALSTSSTVSTNVTDNASATVVTLSASAATVSEGGSITYTATVNNPVTGSPLDITLSNGQHIVIAVGQSSGSSAAFAVRGDDAYVQGTQALNVGISNSSGGNYEALSTSSTVSTNVTDNASATVVTLSASAATVSEGGSITYTATVNNPVTGSPLDITLSNGQHIVIAVGQSSGSSAAFAVRGDDAYVQGTQALNVGISNSSGGNYEALSTSSTVSTNVTDNASATVVTLSASAATVSEGGSITYTATVNNPVTGSPLDITLSNGQHIVIAVGQSSGSSAAFAVRGDDAYVQGTQALNVGISNSSGGNYEALSTSSTVSTNVTDNASATVVTLSASAATVSEGGSITYTATVNNPVTGSPLDITLSNGQHIVIAVGQSSGSSAAFAVRGDDAYVQGTQALNVGISNSSGGNYEALSTSSTVSTNVTDNASATVVTLSASAATVSEGGSITYTATVNNPVTGSPLDITLSNGQHIVIAVGQSSGSSAAFAVRGDDAYVQGTQALNVGISNSSGGNYEALSTSSTVSTNVTDNASATVVTLSASAATVSEGGSITYTATVNNPVTGSPLDITLSNGQHIVIAVGQSSGSSAAFAVRGDDAYVQGTQALNVGISNSSGGNYEALSTSSTVSTNVTDNASATVVTLSASAATVSEGGSITYTATVNNPVTGSPLDITLSNGQHIVIAVGQSSGSSAAFAVRGDDAYVQGTQALNVGISNSSGGNYEALSTSSTVSTNVTDNASATVVTLSASAATVSEGGSITYTATVNNPVTGSPLDITLSNGQHIVIAVGQSSGSSAAFAVRGDDAYVQGTQALNVGISNSSGGNYEALSTSSTVSTNVTDNASATVVTLSASAATVSEGGSITYTATVNNPVTGSPLDITLSNGQHIVIAVGQSSGSSAAFAVRGDDAYVQGTQALNVGISNSSGGNYEALSTSSTVSTNVTDNASATVVTLSASAATVSEGGSITYTATVNNPVTGSPLDITLSNGQHIVIAVGQSSGSSAAFAVRGDDAYVQGTQALNVGISNSSGGNYEALSTSSTVSTNVTDNASATVVTLSASAATVSEGGSITYTATVNNPVTGSPLDITLSNGQHIVIAVGQSSGSSAAFAVRGDDAYVQGTQALNVGISNSSGGNYEALSTSSTVSTNVTDNASATVVTLSASAATVSEGGSITYTATVNNPVTGSPLDITLSNGQHIVIAVGQSSGSSAAFAVRGDDAYVQGTQALNVGISNSSGGNYEALSTSSTVSTNVTDNASATVVTLSASAATVSEGGSITYTATVNNPVTGSPLDITLSNGQHIVIAVGQSSGSSAAFAVRGDDAYVQGTQALNVGISNSSGGNYEALSTSSTVSTNVTDNASATVVTLSASAATVSEGGSITYTATVNNPVTGSPLDITLSNGQHIVIAVGQSSGSSAAFAVRGDDAYVQGTQALNVGISNSSGGNYEALSTSSTVSTNVTDNASATVVTLSASAATVSEGGSITYTATVNNPVTGSPLDITLSNGQHIVIAVGQSSGSSAAFAVRGDDAYVQGTQALNVGISNSSGGNYEALSTSSTVSTNVTDNASATVVTLSATPTVTEGGNITYTATLSNVAMNATVVTLSTGQTITIASGTTTGTVAIAAPDDAYTGNTSTSRSISAVSGGTTFESLSFGTAAATSAITQVTNVTTATLNATSTVAEGGNITYTATLNNVATNAVTVTLSTGQTITIASGATTGTAVIAAPGDDPYIDAGNTSRMITSISGGTTFESLTFSTAAASTSVTDTINVTTVSLSASPTVSEGGNITYTATLTNAATNAVTVTLSTGQTIAIASGATTGTLAIAVANDVYTGNASTSRSISALSGGTTFESLVFSTVAATSSITQVTDVTTISLSATPTVSEGGNITYTATLNNAATSPVTVTLSNGQTISIASGATTGTVLVAAANDVYTGNNTATANITAIFGGTTFESLTYSTVAATSTVTQVTDVTTVSLTASPTVAEGGNITYTATLSNQAHDTTTITLSSGQTLTIASGATAGTVVIAAPSDDVYIDAGTTTRTITAISGGTTFESLTYSTAAASTSVTDTTNVTSVTLSATPTVNEGGSITYTATLTNTAHDTVTVSLTNGNTITIASGAISGTVAVAAPADDPYVDPAATRSASAAISALSGGSTFESLAFSTAVATTTVPDTINVTTLTLSGGPMGVSEGQTASGYTLTLSNVAQTAVTVTLGYSGSATSGSDYTAVTTVVIPSGSTSATFNVATLADALVEGTENMTIAILGTSNNTGAANNFEALSTSGTVTTAIYDRGDDAATVYESALSIGSGGGNAVATGNLFTNDGVTNTSVTNVVYNGTTYTPTAGVINITTTTGTLIVYSTTGGGHTVGDYTYTLTSPATNTAPGTANDLSVVQNFTYTGNASSAALRVSIIDDKPFVSDAIVTIPQSVAPAFTVMLVLDISGSMGSPYGSVKQVNSDGSVTTTDRITMAKAALTALVDEYFAQSPDVQIKLSTFSTGFNFIGTYATKAAADAAIAAIGTPTGGTNYELALDGVQNNFGAVSASRENVVYFLSDGTPSSGNTTNPATAVYAGTGLSYTQWAANNGVSSYGVGIGTGISNPAQLNAINNVDQLGDGVVDPAIIVADLNQLGSQLISTVPQSFGGNVLTGGASNVSFGADGGYVKTITLTLDLDGNGTPDTPVTFTYNPASGGTITSSAPLTGMPATGTSLTLDNAKHFTYGTLVFDFTSGNYTYFSGNAAPAGTTFTLNSSISDNDGDLTSSLQTINIVDGKPLANNDYDTLFGRDTFLEGNVITGAGTDSGLAIGTTVTPFATPGSGVDTIVDGATLTSVVFKGQSINLTSAVGSTALAGGNYTVTYNATTHIGVLTWTNATTGSALTFDSTGYYKYTPPTADIPNPATTTVVSDVNFYGTPLAMTGITLTGSNTVNYGSGLGAGIQGGSNTQINNGESLTITFGSAQYPAGVSNVSVNVDAASNLGGANALTYQIYNTSGTLIGTISNSTAEGTVSLGAYSNVGSVKVTGVNASAAYVSGVVYSSSLGVVELSNAPLAATGVMLDAMTPTSSTINTTASYTVNSGAGVTGGSSGTLVDGLESLVIHFSQANYAAGVQHVSLFINAAASNLGATGSGADPALTYKVYAVDGSFIGQFSSDAEGLVTLPSNFSNIGSIEVQAAGDAQARVQAVSFEGVANNAAAAAIGSEVISYTLTDQQGDTASASLTLNIETNNYYGTSGADTITGTGGNDHIVGAAGNDILTGGLGNDVVEGGAGNDTIHGDNADGTGSGDDTLVGGAGDDTIYGDGGNDILRGNDGNDSLFGGAGNDRLEGGAGNDTLDGGSGNDIIIGGQGNDTLTGAIGSDVFKWELGDGGSKGTPAIDTITDFNTATPAAGGDVLDLRDLLQGEVHGAGVGNLASYIRFEHVGADTKVHVSSTGGFGLFYSPSQEDQTIILQNVDLTAGGTLTTDQQIIQDLLTKGKLVTD